MQSQNVEELGSLGIPQLLLRYSIPTILATVIHATYNVVDRIFVGRLCGEDALAAITVCFSPTLLFLAISMTIGHGSATILSIKLGQGDARGAERALTQSIFLFFLFYLAVASVTLVYMREMLAFFGATDLIIGDACAYYRIIICGLIFEKLSGGMTHVIRAEGRPAYAMATMFITAWANIVLDYLFMVVFEMGVQGAACATVAAQFIGTFWVAYFYASGRGCLKIRLRDFRLHRDLLGSVCAAGSPSFIMQIFASLSVAFYIIQANRYGSEATIAVVGIATAITTFMFLPIVGLGTCMQPIIGYNWGARNMERVRKAFKLGAAVATAICVFFFAVGESCPRLLYMIFLGRGSELLDAGARVLRILILCYPLIGVNIIASHFFQSTKQPSFAIFVAVLRQGVFLIPLLYFLPMYFGLDGLWASFPLSDIAAFIATVFFIRRRIFPRKSL